MYEASSSAVYSSTSAPQFNSQPQQGQGQQYSTTATTALIYQPPIIQPYITPQQYYVQQQMWSASFQQAPAYYPQYTIQQQQPSYQTPEQTQPVPLVNLARLVNSSGQQYPTGAPAGQTMNMNQNPSTSSGANTPGSAPSTRTKMVPAIFKNMGGGARTKAKMREMLEQQKKIELEIQQRARAEASSPKKKRIRKPKASTNNPANETNDSEVEVKPKAPRGRPRKSDNEKEKEMASKPKKVKVKAAKPAATSNNEGSIDLSQSINSTIQNVVTVASQVPSISQSQATEQSDQSSPVVGSPTSAKVPKKKGRPRKYPWKYPDYYETPPSMASTSTSASAQLSQPSSVAVLAAKNNVTPEKKTKAEKRKKESEEAGTEAKKTSSAKSPKARKNSSSVAAVKVEVVTPPPAKIKKVSAPSHTSQVDIATLQPAISSPPKEKIEKKSKLSPNSAAVLKAKASEKLKTAKVRVRTKALKETGKSEEAVRAQMAAAALKLKNGAKLKTPRVRVKKLKLPTENSNEDGQAQAQAQAPPAKISKKLRPTDESMDETIDYVLGHMKQEKKIPQELPHPTASLPPFAIASTSAASRLALQQQTAPPVIMKTEAQKKAKGPTVMVKKSDLKVLKRLSGKERKEHRQKGPTLKVRQENVTFYRGGEEEDEPVVRVGLERPRVDFDESVPWRCVFCNYKPFSFGLGDLFGPYYVDRVINGQVQPTETWLHSGCSVWASGVVLIGSTLYGLTDAVLQSEQVLCTICKKPGATIACFQRRCREAVHLPCAVLNKWSLSEKDFRSQCPTHAPQAPPDVDVAMDSSIISTEDAPVA